MKKIFFLILPSVFLVALFFGIHGVLAQVEKPEATVVDRGLGVLVYIVLGFVAQAFVWIGGWLLNTLIGILITIAQYNDFLGMTAVNTAWVVVRDISNMFFILILLVIAFATILRVESYQYKKLLPRVVLMAILINFSKTIAGLMIDAGQVVMLTFVNGFAAAGGGNLAVGFGLDKLLAEQKNAGGGGVLGQFIAAQNDPKIATINYLLAIVYVILAVVTIAVMIAMLLFRMVMLWMLIAISPLAFLLSAFPQGQEYASKWWKEFTSAVVVGPVLAFFIWMAMVAMAPTSANSRDSGLKGIVSGPALTNLTTGTSELGLADNTLAVIIAIGMLWGGIYVTQQIGGMVASKAGGWAEKGTKLGLQGAKKAIFGTAKFAGDRLNRLQGKYLTGIDVTQIPGKVKQGFAARKEADMKAIAKRGGAYQQALAGRGGLPLYMALASPDKFVQEYAGIGDFFTKFVPQVGRGILPGIESYKQKYDRAAGLRRDAKTVDGGNKRIEELDKYIQQPTGANSSTWSWDDKIDAQLISNLDQKRNELEQKKAQGVATDNEKKDLENIQNIQKEKKITRDEFKKHTGTDDTVYNSYTEGSRDEANQERASLRSNFGATEKDRRKRKEGLENEALTLEAEYLRNVPEHLIYDLEGRKAEAEAMKNIPSNVTGPELLRRLKQAYAKGPEDVGAFNGIVKKMAQDGSLSDVLDEFGYSKDFKGFQEFIQEKVKTINKGSEGKAFEVGYDMSRNAEKAGEIQYGGAYKMDAKTGKVSGVGLEDASTNVAKRVTKGSAFNATKMKVEAYVSDDKLTVLGAQLISSFDKGFKEMMEKGTFPPALLQALQRVEEKNNTISKMQDKRLVSPDFLKRLQENKEKERPPNARDLIGLL